MRFAGLVMASAAVMVIAVWGPETLAKYGTNSLRQKPLEP